MEPAIAISLKILLYHSVKLHTKYKTISDFVL